MPHWHRDPTRRSSRNAISFHFQLTPSQLCSNRLYTYSGSEDSSTGNPTVTGTYFAAQLDAPSAEKSPAEVGVLFVEVWMGSVAAYMWTRGIGTATKPHCGIGSPGPLFRPDSRVRPRVHLHNGLYNLAIY